MADMYSWPEILTTVLDGKDLSVSESTWAMRQVMQGDATPSQLAGFLVGLRAKGETVDEIVGFRDAILEAAVPLPVRADVLDIVGTGGDRYGTVNVSTTASVVVAASGIPVVKHGNRASSSKSGSSDVLAALGVDLAQSPERVAQVLDEVGITFAFASAFHPGFRHAGPTRAELGIPTVFNFLGPLCNPARAEANAVGVAHLDRVPLITGVFQTRGRQRWSSAGMTAWMSSRRPATAGCGRSAAAMCASMTSTLGISASLVRRSRTCSVAMRSTTRVSCGGFWTARRGRCATSSC